MININCYLDALTAKLRGTFGARLLYIGLQGSYLRGEAADHSDIDVMVVLDTLTLTDLDAYRRILREVGHFDLSCGFLCGRKELCHWSPLEIGHLLHTTKDIYGILSDYTPKYLENDVRDYVKIGLCSLYHELCHRYVHASDNRKLDDLVGSYKSVFFLMQNLFFLEHGQFITTQSDLLSVLCPEDRVVLRRAMDLRRGVKFDFEESFSLLFTWCQNTLNSL